MKTKNKPNIALHIITGLKDGGAESALYHLCIHNPQNQHVVVSLMDEGKYGPLLVSAGIEVHCLRMPQGKVSLVGLGRLWRLLRLNKPDAVQTWMYHANLIGGFMARLAGVRNIVWGIHHSNLTPGTIKLSTIWIAKLSAAMSAWVPSRIVCCSQQAVEAHKRIGYAADKFRLVPNGYDLARLTPNAASGLSFRTALNLPAGVPLIGTVARFDTQKDHANLLAALGQLKRQGQAFHCLLVGTGMDAANATLADWLRQHDLTDRVTLLGRRNDIDAVMNALDIHVLSSLGEAFPNVLAEAMACGTPCVTTDVGDAAYIVGDTGWVVPPQDSGALARGIQSALAALADTTVWKARQQAARQRIEDHFTIERVVGLYDAVWREGLAKP
jgi:glycosyltransferase involved in cell wall biosynthesis